MYGVALVPNKVVVRELVAFRNEFSEFFSGPEWGLKFNVPHVALFKTELKSDANPNLLVKNVYDNADFDVPVSVFSGISLENRGWVFGNVVKNEFVEAMHDSAKNSLKPFIDKDKIKHKKFMGETIEDVETYLKYGYRYVGERFSSQFIFGRYNGVDSELAYTMVETYEKKFLGNEVLFSKVVIYKTRRSNVMGPIVASKKLQTFKERLFIS